MTWFCMIAICKPSFCPPAARRGEKQYERADVSVISPNRLVCDGKSDCSNTKIYTDINIRYHDTLPPPPLLNLNRPRAVWSPWSPACVSIGSWIAASVTTGVAQVRRLANSRQTGVPWAMWSAAGHFHRKRPGADELIRSHLLHYSGTLERIYGRRNWQVYPYPHSARTTTISASDILWSSDHQWTLISMANEPWQAIEYQPNLLPAKYQGRAAESSYNLQR